jgi:dTMP kinase
MLVSLDGIDGCGKSTQVERLAAHMGARRIQEISDSRWGRLFRSLKSPSLAQQMACFLADRASLAPMLEEAAGSRRVHIVSDRSYLSGLAYQSWHTGFEPGFLEEMNRTLVPEYDLMLVLDLPVETAFARISSRGAQLAWCEDPARLQWCRQVFLDWAGRRPNIRVVDASRSVEQVWAQVLACYEDVASSRFGEAFRA